MILCSDCYIQKDGKTLMLLRNKKESDINKNKYIGLGGKFEPGESPEECLIREVKEEAGVTLNEYKLRGIVTFSTIDGDPQNQFCIFIYTASGYTGKIGSCDEGELHWIDNDKILDLNLWEGDRLFWRWILEGKPFFSAKFVYDDDTLVNDEVVFYE